MLFDTAKWQGSSKPKCDPFAKVRRELADHRSANSRRANAAQSGQCEALLGANTFDATAIKALSGRATYPEAARFLRRAIGHRADTGGGLITILITGGQFLALRLSIHFGIVEEQAIRTLSMNQCLYTIADVHQRARTKPAAFLVLAALGEPHAPWPTLTRQQRAAFCLGRLVEAMRERAS